MPFHAQLVTTLITGSVVFCMLLGLFGFLSHKSPKALPPEPLFPDSNFPCVFSYFYTICFGIIFAMGSIQSYIHQESNSAVDYDLTSFCTNALFQIALYIPFLIIYLRLPSRNYSCTWGQKVLWVPRFLLLMLIPGIILETMKLPEWIAEVTGAPLLQDVVTTIKDGPIEIKITMMVMAVLVAPMTEEVYFRGFVYNILKRWTSPVPAAIASSFFFAIVHASLTQTIPLTFFALIQCWAYEKSRSLWLPIILHMLFNAISCLAILFLID